MICKAQGAGPKTVEALKELRDKTKSAKSTADVTSSPATVPDSVLNSGGGTTSSLSTQAEAVIPPPDSVRQQKILDSMKDYARNYTANLPNFLCVEVTNRFIDPRSQENYRSGGKIMARVRFYEGQEKYEVYSVNGKMQDTGSMMEVGGSVSTGEFASLMRSIFDPGSDATFNWERWGKLRGRVMAVFSYSIDSGHSSYRISHGSEKEGGEQIITAYSGSVYADPETGEVTRIKFQAIDLPRSFPVKATTETLDYDLVDISGQKYVLPLAAKLWMKAEDGESKNDIEFRAYRKFETGADIKYDDIQEASKPLPTSKTEEGPATAKPVTPAPVAPKSTNPFDLPSAPPPPPRG